MSRDHRRKIKKYNTLLTAIRDCPHLYGVHPYEYFDIASFGVFVRNTKHWPRATDLDLAAI